VSGPREQTDPPLDSDPPRRYLPDRPLPPYSYVTRHWPHPTRDPAGHSYGQRAPAVDPPDSARPGDCAEFLWGVDLFNYGYYWEAHEAWEAVWVACGRRGQAADFLKGLIKLAAAGVKAREGRNEGVVRHARRAGELFAHVCSSSESTVDVSRTHFRMFGLSLAGLLANAETAATIVATVKADRSNAVQIVFPFQLHPAI